MITLEAPKVSIDLSSSEKDKLQERYSASVRSLLGSIQRLAQARTPKRTGRLRAGYSIHIGGSFPRLEGRIINPIPYFKFVEYGWKLRRGGRKVGAAGVLGLRRVRGIRMFSSSMEEHKQDLDRLETDFANDFRDILKVKSL